MNNYPDRVTLYEDGVYRWSYVMDMWKNRYMIRLVWKIIVPLLGLPLLLIAAMVLKRAIPMMQEGVPRETLMFYLKSDLLALCVVAGLMAAILLLTELIYAGCALAMHGKWRISFEMDESAVALVRNQKTMNTMNAVGTVVGIIGLVAGKPGDSLRIGGSLAAMNANGTSRFESARRVKQVRKYDVLDVREWFGMNQVYVPAEGYDYVRDFMLARVSEKARQRSQKEK